MFISTGCWRSPAQLCWQPRLFSFATQRKVYNVIRLRTSEVNQHISLQKPEKEAVYRGMSLYIYHPDKVHRTKQNAFRQEPYLAQSRDRGLLRSQESDSDLRINVLLFGLSVSSFVSAPA